MSAAAAAPALPAAAPQQVEEEEERDGTTHFLVRSEALSIDQLFMLAACLGCEALMHQSARCRCCRGEKGSKGSPVE